MQNKINALSKEEIIKRLTRYKKEENYKNKENLFWIYTNAILNKNLDEIKVENIEVVDPTSILYSKNKEIFFQKDGLHLNENGNKVIAEKIIEDLLSKKTLKNK